MLAAPFNPGWLSIPTQVLLHLARGLFEDTTKLEVVINKMMQQSMELIPCVCCAVLLLDTDNKDASIGREEGGGGGRLREMLLCQMTAVMWDR